MSYLSIRIKEFAGNNKNGSNKQDYEMRQSRMKKGITQRVDNRLTMTIPEFAEIIELSRNLACSLARQDKLPVPVIKLGPKRLVVSRRAVEQLLNEGKPIMAADEKPPF